MSNYSCISGENEYLEIIEKSKFICNAKFVDNEEQAKEFINSIKKKNSLASHWCYAFIADDKGLVQKFSDDGEPQGTAGLPMLNVLKNRKIYKTAVVVTRYFGGVKLGTGGLTRAYGGVVSKCLDSAKILNMQSVDFYNVVTDYDGYVKIIGKKGSEFYKIKSTEFAQNVTVQFAVKTEKEEFIKSFSSFISDITKGSATIDKTSSGYCDF